jgi:hypothetical protein
MQVLLALPPASVGVRVAERGAGWADKLQGKTIPVTAEQFVYVCPCLFFFLPGRRVLYVFLVLTPLPDHPRAGGSCGRDHPVRFLQRTPQRF